MNGTPLPDGWDMLSIKDIALFAPKASGEVLASHDEVSFLPMAAVSEVSGKCDLSLTISPDEGKRRNLSYFENNDIIFAKITPCMENGKIARVVGLLGGRGFGSTEFHVLRPKANTLGDYLRYYLVHDDFRINAERAMTGAVGQRRVPKKYLENHAIPLPSVAEQQRIVDLVEHQLSRLEAVIGAVQSIRKKAAQFRRSLFRVAFSGSSVSDKAKWKTLPLRETLDFSIGGVWGEAPGESEINVDVVRVTELRPHGLVDASTAVCRSITRRQYESRALKEGDLLLEKSGGGPNTPVGRVGIISSVERPTVCANFMQLMRPNAGIVRPRFLHQYLVFFHADGQTIPLQTSTTNIRNIKTKDYLMTPVAVPCLEEQDAIVDQIEEQLSHLDATLAVVDEVERRASAFRRSLLSSAFSGELTRIWREANG